MINKRILRIIGITFLVSTIFSCDSEKKDDKLDEVRNLTERLLPGKSAMFEFDIIKNDYGNEKFKILITKNKIRISGNSISAITTGINYYLKYYCKIHFSRAGSNKEIKENFTILNDSISKESPFKYRYYLNYCTYNYSMAFWSWEEWERELDWMALNGINLPLAIIGTEKVWQNTLRKFKFNDKEIKEFIPGPAFTAWWLMDNLEGWGGPVSQQWIDSRVILQQKIVTRMRELGMKPIFQGFYGMVPNKLKEKFPKSRILRDTGNWCGGFQRPAFLDPSDVLFSQMAKVYYEEMEILYGKGLFFGGDPLHEGGKLEGVINKIDAAINIQKAMQKTSPGSTWILQGWWENPSDSLLMGTNKSKTIVLDLWGETQPFWEKRNSFLDRNFIWCSLQNFGSKVGLWGRLDTLAKQPFRALASPYGSNLKGIGLIMEGNETNPVVYDFLYENAWETSALDPAKWIEEYVGYRYGQKDPNAIKAWRLLLKHVYNCEMGSYDGLGSTAKGYTDMAEAVICARPKLNVKNVSAWGPTIIPHYNNDILLNAFKLLLSSKEKFKNVDSYQYDIVDICRQLLSNKALTHYLKLNDAFNSKNSSQFTMHSNLFLNLIKTEDTLLCSRKEFLLGRWLSMARNAGFNKKESDLFEWNAKMLITLWGNEKVAKQLHDYSYREWAGMLDNFYYERWKLFFDNITHKPSLKMGKQLDFYSWEKEWVKSKKTFLSETKGDPVTLCEKFLANEFEP